LLGIFGLDLGKLCLILSFKFIWLIWFLFFKVAYLAILNILKNLLLIYIYVGMTTGHRIEPKIFRKRKRPKATSSNAKIARVPFRDKSTKILLIPTFIDDYNHYMGGVD
jgi:hypothetical protein